MQKRSFLTKFVVGVMIINNVPTLRAYAAGDSCSTVLEDILFDKNSRTKASPNFTDAKVELDIDRLNASWEISRLGVGELLSQLHNMEGVLYYSMTALLAKENVLIDGPGGGAKTLALRKIYQAQLNAVNKADTSEISERYRESYELQRTLIEIINKDAKESDAKHKIFTQQFHATLSESKILGGPDPFKFIGDGRYEIDYKKALIHESNMFAILDELEKAPVSLQMTLLSILNERQALVGNKIIQTMLESVAATTNATLGELISQALPHEVGGRRALIDRFPIKIHTVNISVDAMDAFLLVEKVERAKNENKYVVIDLRGLRPLLDKISIPKEVLKAMTDITLQLDRAYTSYLLKAQAEVEGTQLAPTFYPAFSGSTRIQSRVIKLWQSAFISRQLLMGVPFEQIRMSMKPQDLVDLAPALLQGGPDFINPKLGVRIPFVQALDRENFTILGSNSKNPRMQKFNLSVGYYDPYTQTFQYNSALTGELRKVYFDSKNKKLVSNDASIKSEIFLDPDDIALLAAHPRTQKYLNLEESLVRVEANPDQYKKFQKQNPNPAYAMGGRLQKLIQNAPLREASKKQLEETAYFHQEFVDLVNLQIKLLNGKSLTAVDHEVPFAKLNEFNQTAKTLQNEITAALAAKDEQRVQKLAVESVQQSFKELSYLIRGTESLVKAIFEAIINKKNIMLFGPPGSAKTMLSRIIFEKEIEGISELQVAKLNSVLSEKLQQMHASSESLWIKQFHPMSNEGDIVGRIDIAALKRGEGYSYNRTGSLSAKDVLFSLLDEFEKAPPAVRTSLLSLLNERQLMDGDLVVQSSLIAVILATNSTPSEFIIGQGEFSTSFPIYDRIQIKAYNLNKLTPKNLEDFHQRMYLKVPLTLRSPLMIHPLMKVADSYQIRRFEKMLLAQIHQELMIEMVKKSDAERTMYLSDSQAWPDFYMNSRGESARTFTSAVIDELKGTVLIDRILRGDKLAKITDGGFQFELTDLESFAELYLTHNSMVKVVHEYDNQGFLTFKVVENDLSQLLDRIDRREEKTFEYLKWEAEQVVQVLNRQVQAFLKNQMRAIAQYSNLYPSAFAGKEDRVKWLKAAGFTEDQIQKAANN